MRSAAHRKPEVVDEVAPAAPAARSHPARFWIGVLVMALSFLVYPGYGLIAALPLSPSEKLEAGVAAWMTSWGSFALGSALAGAEGAEFLRRLVRRKRGETSPD